mmetsp:Transcript_10941/g.27259  ORF Transcript_10941/g.27259 Transcript_10941/m.27259 type:complete len:263 (+) Transcript_10941:1407-2195(+)
MRTVTGPDELALRVHVDLYHEDLTGTALKGGAVTWEKLSNLRAMATALGACCEDLRAHSWIGIRRHRHRRVLRCHQAEHGGASIVNLCACTLDGAAQGRPEGLVRGAIPERVIPQLLGHEVLHFSGPQSWIHNALRCNCDTVVQKCGGEGVLGTLGFHCDWMEFMWFLTRLEHLEKVIIGAATPRNVRTFKRLIVLQCASEIIAKQLGLRKVRQKHGMNLVELPGIPFFGVGVEVGRIDAVPIAEAPSVYHGARSQMQERPF